MTSAQGWEAGGQHGARKWNAVKRPAEGPTTRLVLQAGRLQASSLEAYRLRKLNAAKGPAVDTTTRLALEAGRLQASSLEAYRIRKLNAVKGPAVGPTA